MTAKTTTKKPDVAPTPVAPTPEFLSKKTLSTLVDLPARAAKLSVITTDEQCHEADQLDKMCAETIKGITAELADGKKKAYDAWKWFTAYETEKTAPLVAARRRLSGLVSGYLIEKQRIADIETERLRVEAAEQARLDAERKKETEIAVLIQEGRMGEVGELMAADVVVENVAVVRSEPVKPVGLGMGLVSRWSAEVYDLKALVRAVADGKIPLGTVENPGPVMVNQAYLNKVATLEKSTMDYPGVRAKETKGTSR